MFVSCHNLPTRYLLCVCSNSANVLTVETRAVLVTGTTANSMRAKWREGETTRHPLFQMMQGEGVSGLGWMSGGRKYN